MQLLLITGAYCERERECVCVWGGGGGGGVFVCSTLVISCVVQLLIIVCW